LSGAGSEKGDVRRGAGYKVSAGQLVISNDVRLRIEAKTTEQDVYSFKAQDWVDISRSADAAAENPVFAICFLPEAAGRHYRVAMQLVLIRAAFAAELELRGNEAVPADIMKSWALSYPRLRDKQQRRCIRVNNGRRMDTLVLVDYDPFLKALARYEEENANAAAPVVEYSRNGRTEEGR
jgi:hypothetical protein